MKTDEANPDHWFSLASGRLHSSDLLFKVEGPSLAAIELLHEAAERYLKGYLIAQGWSLQRTHDLGVLVDEAVRRTPVFDAISDALERLTDQFWAQHYPGADLTGVGLGYPEIRTSVEAMIQLISESLGREISHPNP